MSRIWVGLLCLAVAVGCREADVTRVTLHGAAEAGDVATAERLLNEGADVNARDEGGGTALHVAAVRGDVGMITLLMGRGADVNAKDRDEDTPLDFARDDGIRETMNTLAMKNRPAGQNSK